MSSATPDRASRRKKTFAAIALAAFAALLAPLGMTAAAAAPNVPAGVYSGAIGQSTSRTVTFPVSSAGVIGEIQGQTYMYCSGWPVPIYWGGNPPIQIADNGSFSAEYWFTYDDETSDTRFRFSGSISAGGIATGEMKVHMPNLPGCAEGTEPFTAELVEAALDPEISVAPSSVTVSELANNGVTVNGSDFPAGTAVALSIGGTDAGTATTASDGTFSTTASASVSPGTHTVTATAGGETATASIVVEADPIVYNPEISVTPSTVTVSELADGVTVEGSDFPAGTAVALSIGGTDAGTATTA
ncbi:MAG: hypothetical protein ACTIJ7_08285, partial [Agrococcus casei]|uniref:hypothetical protein n=1 Tax=Agrococcus casei TaxID=343512 RepID=UPI003F9C94B5